MLEEHDPFVPDKPIKVNGFYSDYLYANWRCASAPLHKLIRTSSTLENIDRRSNLSLDEFIDQYALPNKPVIITDVVQTWPAYQKWSMKYLLKHYADVEFRAEAVDLPFKTYASYSERCSSSLSTLSLQTSNCSLPDTYSSSPIFLEEAPLYLFDKHFPHRTNLSEDFTVPIYFQEDLFKLLSPSERPDYRWIIIGN